VSSPCVESPIQLSYNSLLLIVSMYCGLCISNLDQVLNSQKKTNDSSLTIPSEEDVKELVYFSGRDYDTMKNFLHRYCGNSLVIAIRSLVLAEKRVIEEDLLIDSALFDDGRLSSNLNCKICMDPLTIEETFVSNCGHYYHTLCMKMHIMSCMDDGEFSVFPCPQKQVYPKCGKDITVNELRAILGEQDFERCQYRAAQKLFSSDSSFFCCPSPDCSNVVWLDPDGQGAVCEEKGGCEMSCALCSRSTCVLCSAQPFHHGEMCSSRSANQGDEEAATYYPLPYPYPYTSNPVL
jgi:hypothetical protein